MSILATVENGVVKLPADAGLPDGTPVRVEMLEAATPNIPLASDEDLMAERKDPDAGKSFGEIFAKYVGCVKDGPGDLAVNHDHYLYGTPKREECPPKTRE